eukprot:805124-Pyramimonas_sp.AAC.1
MTACARREDVAAAPPPRTPNDDCDRFNEIWVAAAELFQQGVVDPDEIMPREGLLRTMPPACF